MSQTDFARELPVISQTDFARELPFIGQNYFAHELPVIGQTDVARVISLYPKWPGGMRVAIESGPPFGGPC